MSSNAVQEVLGHADAVLFREKLDANPQFVSQLSPPLQMVYDWVIVIVRLLYQLILLVLNVSNDRIDSLEDQFNDLQANPIFDYQDESAPQPALVASASTTPRAPQRPSKSTRCQRCHTMGHAVADCRTQDLATIKKRVAASQKAAKDMERQRIATLLPRTSAANSRFTFELADFFGDHPPSISSSQQSTRTVAAMAADATELHRSPISLGQAETQVHQCHHINP